MAEEASSDAGLRRLREHPRPQGGNGPAGRHRTHRADGHGLVHAPLAGVAFPRVRRGRAVVLVVPAGQGQGRGGRPRGHPGVPPPPVPPRLHLHQRPQGHPGAQGPRGQDRGTQELAGPRRCCGSAASWETSTACRSRTWSGAPRKEEDVPFDPPEGLRMERLPKGKRVEEMLAEGELDAVIHPDVLSPILDGDTPGSSACSTTPRRSSWTTSAAPASSPSCTPPSSGGRSWTSTRGFP